MGRKIFFLDLDGTLLTDDKLISADTYSALKKFCEAGNVIAVNSENWLNVEYLSSIGFNVG